MAENPTFQMEHELGAAMKGVDFPVDRDALVEKARENGASDEVVQRLQQLREGEFSNVAEVMDATND
jgi:hypothetical protein